METRSCKNCNAQFVIDEDDAGFYERMGVPHPTFCPRCRRIRRLSWRNDYNLYNRECDLCHTKFISMYAPNSGMTIYCPKCFHSDKWDPYAYGMEYDPSRPFLEQVVELFRRTPAIGIINDNDIASVNSLYNQDIGFSKNCTMVFVGWKMENVLYSFYINEGKDFCDCLGVLESCEFTYDSVMIEHVSRSRNMYWCSSSTDCAFCYDSRGCTDCFMSFGLRNKQYYFKNQQYSREEYKQILESYHLETRSGSERALAEFAEFLKDKPRKFAELRSSVLSTGTDIIRGKHTRDSNFASLSEDSRYTHNGVAFKACYDCAGGGETELEYECITPDHSNNGMGTLYSWKNTNIAYGMNCHSCANIAGCVSVKKGEHVILNKRYQKEEYFQLRDKIVADMKARGEWGEFFPMKLSPFGINETRAIEELRLSREEALAQGFAWQDDTQQTKGKETLSQSLVPDSILSVEDSILKEVLTCVLCERNYRILADELTFYRRMHIPLPMQCFFCRHLSREQMRGGFDLVHRQCDCKKENHSNHSDSCANQFETFFTNREPRPIYCEECYQQELI